MWDLITRNQSSKKTIEYWQDFQFLKLLVKYDFLEGLNDYSYPSYLLYWSLFEMEVLKFVVPVLQNDLQL